MALILNLETSSSACSVCLSQQGQVTAFKESLEHNSHARLLTVLIEELMQENKVDMQQLDAVAVSAGPGSYTGLRIGVSAAKGLCYALGKPLIGIPTLTAVAERMKQITHCEEGFYMPAIDAGRMDAYTAVYNLEGNEIIETGCSTIDHQLEGKLSSLGKVFIGGNATAKCKSVFTSPQFTYLNDINCDSRWMAPLSEKKFSARNFEDLAYFVPLYLKEFVPKPPRKAHL